MVTTDFPGQVLFIPHGGGPLPLLGDPGHQELVSFLEKAPLLISKPAAIVMISAHWEEPSVAITGGSLPPLIYDYHGFPEKAYEFQYPAPGNPALANRISNLLGINGIDSYVDSKRGFDHGMFVPLALMYPDADIPCVQISLVSGLDPKLHIQIGNALSELRKDDVLIIGSGFSFHNMNELGKSGSKKPDTNNDAFQKWLIETCTSEELSSQEREMRLLQWEQQPFSRYCHPREEHLLPLHICYGLSSSKAQLLFNGTVLGKKTCAFLW